MRERGGERERESGCLVARAGGRSKTGDGRGGISRTVHTRGMVASSGRIRILAGGARCTQCACIRICVFVCESVFICRHINFCIFVSVYNTRRVIARPATPEYFPAGHRTHAVLAATSEYVPAGHEQHALVAFLPSSVALPVRVCRVFIFFI
jgi:hypothetical protein